MNHVEEIKRRFRSLEVARLFKSEYLGRFIMTLFHRSEQRKHDMLLRNIPVSEILLDGGCGDGVHSNGFTDKASWVIGLDIIKKYLVSYRKRLGEKVSCIFASLDYLPFRPCILDVCVLQDSLEHTKDVRSVIRQVAMILKRKGVVVAIVPNWYNRFLDANPFSVKTHTHNLSSVGWESLFDQHFSYCNVSCVTFPVIDSPFLARNFHLFGVSVMLRGVKT